MKKLTLAMMLIFSLAASAFAQSPDAKAKAEQILKQARAAIGSESKLKALQALSASGTVRNTFGQFQMESTLELEMMMPDKIKKTTDGQRGTNIAALNGANFWRDNIAPVGGGGFGGPGGPGGGGGGNRQVVIGGAAGAGGPGRMGANSPMGAYMQQQGRRELLQVMLGLVLAAPESAQLQYTYLAEAPGPDGTKLDVIEAKGTENFTVRLYLDQQSHQLVGMIYKGKSMTQGRRTGGPGGPGGAAGPGAPPPPGGQAGAQGGGQGNRPAQAGQAGAAQGQGQGQRVQLSPEEMEKRMKEAAEAFEKSPDVDFRWAFADYKSVGGLNLPHRITKFEAGTANEEWEISKYKINPKLTADKFEKKEKEKAAN